MCSNQLTFFKANRFGASRKATVKLFFGHFETIDPRGWHFQLTFLWCIYIFAPLQEDRFPFGHVVQMERQKLPLDGRHCLVTANGESGVMLTQ